MVSGRPGNSAPSVPDSDASALGALVAKQKLYENLALYCRGQDRKDLELVKSTFWPEATDNHGMWNGSAHEFCEWAHENQKTTQHRSHHYITNVLIELDGDVARRESAVVFVMVPPDGGPIDVLSGRYRDFCERRDDAWKVLRRVMIHDYAARFDPAGDQATILRGLPETARWGDVYPNDPIHDDEW